MIQNKAYKLSGTTYYQLEDKPGQVRWTKEDNKYSMFPEIVKEELWLTSTMDYFQWPVQKVLAQKMEEVLNHSVNTTAT